MNEKLGLSNDTKLSNDKSAFSFVISSSMSKHDNITIYSQTGLRNLKEPHFQGPLTRNTVQMTLIKGAPVLSSHFLSFPWMTP